jgi:hypothetical protein
VPTSAILAPVIVGSVFSSDCCSATAPKCTDQHSRCNGLRRNVRTYRVSRWHGVSMRVGRRALVDRTSTLAIVMAWRCSPVGAESARRWWRCPSPGGSRRARLPGRERSGRPGMAGRQLGELLPR